MEEYTTALPALSSRNIITDSLNNAFIDSFINILIKDNHMRSLLRGLAYFSSNIINADEHINLECEIIVQQLTKCLTISHKSLRLHRGWIYDRF